MKKTKRIVVLMVVVCLLISLTACQTTVAPSEAPKADAAITDAPAADAPAADTPAADAKKLRVIFVAPAVAMPVWLGAKEGMDAASADLGIEVLWAGADDHSVDKTVEAFEQAIAEKPDGIVVCPFAPAAFETAMSKAKEAGIAVTAVTVDTTSEDQRAAFVGTDSWACGTLMAETLHKQVGDEMKIGVIMSNLDSENQVIQVNAVKDYIKKLPKSKIVDTQEDLTDMSKCMEVFSAMIDANPDMNALICTEGNGASALAQVLKERDLTDKICVLAMDDTDQNLQVIRDGGIYGLIAQNFFKMGYLGTQYAADAAQGKTVPSITDSGTTLIVKENVDTYKDEM